MTSHKFFEIFKDKLWIFQNIIKLYFGLFITAHKQHLIGEKKDMDKTCMKTEKKINYIVRDNHFTFFAVSLFTKRSASGAELMLPINQRNVRASNYDIKNDFQTTINDVIHESKNTSFQNSPCNILFGKLVKGKTTDLPIRSVMEVSYRRDNTVLQGQTVIKNNCNGAAPNLSDILLLSVLFNTPVLNNYIHGEVSIFDYKTILHHLSRRFTQSTFRDNFVKDHLGMPFYTFDYVNGEELVALCNDHYNNICDFREFIQYMTPIFVSHNEGNHRALIGTRSYYGYSVNEIFPLTTEHYLSSPIPDDSTVFQPLDYVYYIPYSDITLEYCSKLKEESTSIAKMKNSYLPLQWSDAFKFIYNEVVKCDNIANLYEDINSFCHNTTDAHNEILKDYANKITECLCFLEPPLIETSYMLDVEKKTNGYN